MIEIKDLTDTVGGDQGANMRIWNRVNQTDPKHTEKVSYGARKFTSIDAYYQIQRATELFGPIGIGWGYDASLDIAHPEFVFVELRLWYKDGEITSAPIVTFSACETKSEKGKIDSDAPKKALTDALKKAFSLLGMSADVFLGLYDDDKYVQEMRRKHSADAKPKDNPPDAPKDEKPKSALSKPMRRSLWDSISARHPGAATDFRQKLLETVCDECGFDLATINDKQAKIVIVNINKQTEEADGETNTN